MIMHAGRLNKDVLVKVYHIDHSRSSQLFEHTAHLTKLRSEFLLNPELSFSWMLEYWMVFSWHPGRSMRELVRRARPEGIQDPRLLGRILLDILEGLDSLHNAVGPKGEHLVHRSLALDTLYLVTETGKTMLTDFTNAKFFTDEAAGRPTRWGKPGSNAHWAPPEHLGIFAD